MEFTLRTEQAINHITRRYKNKGNKNLHGAFGVEGVRGRGSALAVGVAGGTVNENVLCIEKSMHHSRLACPGKRRKNGGEESRENT